MYLFLQGAVQTGKTTILHNALLPHEKHVAGLAVQRLFEDSAICGFRACVVEGALPAVETVYSKDMENVFLYQGYASPVVLEQAISQAAEVCAEEHCKLILLDEIGGLELLSPTFIASLRNILALGKPCIGVIKSRENLARTAERLNLPAEILSLRDALQQTIEANGTVLTMTEKNREETSHTVELFAKNSLNGTP